MALDFSWMDSLPAAPDQQPQASTAAADFAPDQEPAGAAGSGDSLPELMRAQGLPVDLPDQDKPGGGEEPHKKGQNKTSAGLTIKEDLLHGIRAGLPAEDLLLKAAKAIADITEDADFYRRFRLEYETVYGLGLGQLGQLKKALTRAKAQRAKLDKAWRNPYLTEAEANIITASVDAHDDLISDLEIKIEQAKREGAGA